MDPRVPLVLGFLVTSVHLSAGLYAGRRWGPVANGFVTALPLTQTTAVLLIGLGQGAEGARQVVSLGPAGVALTLVFAVSALLFFHHLHLARRRPRVESLLVALLLACLLYGALAWVAERTLPVSLAVALVVFAVVFALAQGLLRRLPDAPGEKKELGLAVILLAGALGGLATAGAVQAGTAAPLLAAALAVVPVKTTANLFFGGKYYGVPYAIRVTRSLSTGLLASVTFHAATALLLGRTALGLVPSVAVALVAALGVGMGLFLASRAKPGEDK